jgi:hypothetical protein
VWDWGADFTASALECSQFNGGARISNRSTKTYYVSLLRPAH